MLGWPHVHAQLDWSWMPEYSQRRHDDFMSLKLTMKLYSSFPALSGISTPSIPVCLYLIPLPLVQLLPHLAQAQSPDGIPNCAFGCITKALRPACNPRPACICTSDAFIDATSCCVKEACSETIHDATKDWAKSICMQSGFSPLAVERSCRISASTGSGRVSVGAGARVAVNGGIGVLILLSLLL